MLLFCFVKLFFFCDFIKCICDAIINGNSYKDYPRWVPIAKVKTGKEVGKGREYRIGEDGESSRVDSFN